MFTGLIEEIGTIEKVDYVNSDIILSIDADVVLTDLAIGDSIAIDGACLTVIDRKNKSFSVGIAMETQEKTSFREVCSGDPVNLERSLRMDGRLGGHFVQGHVDGIGEIEDVKKQGESVWISIKASTTLLRYIVPKGFVAIDGISLTVVNVSSETFDFMLVSYTQNHVVLSSKKIGESVNIEVDMLGKYVERYMEGTTNAIRQS